MLTGGKNLILIFKGDKIVYNYFTSGSLDQFELKNLATLGMFSSPNRSREPSVIKIALISL